MVVIELFRKPYSTASFGEMASQIWLDTRWNAKISLSTKYDGTGACPSLFFLFVSTLPNAN